MYFRRATTYDLTPIQHQLGSHCLEQKQRQGKLAENTRLGNTLVFLDLWN